ncbi:MAG: cob(I)yrinic acid a,c-diamide adenosyltransferase [Anaerolineales bacterium]|jgi:cob(I)alamin adenosyltransferase
MSSFYTRNGDDGFTGLLGAGRVAKSDDRIEALGAIDEVTSVLGLARSLCKTRESARLLVQIQHDLYLLMSEVAATPDNVERFRRLDAQRIVWLEEQINQLQNVVNIPQEFIIPGDTPSSAALDIARTVTRRAERRVAKLWHEEQLSNQNILRYLNRLSSFCFILELYENQQSGLEHPTLAKKE